MHRIETEEPLHARAQQRASGLRFARSIYVPRVLGLAFGMMCVGMVLWRDGAHPLALAAVAANGLLWPHVAYAIARRSDDPRRAELRNLVFDSGAGGVWVVLMAFRLLPSALLVVMLAMDKLITGGPKFVGRCLAVQVLAGLVTGLLFGFEFRPETTMPEVVASLPLLVGYPLVVGFMSYRLARRVRDQNRRLGEMVRIDGLTDLYNRRAWEEAVTMEFQRVRRIGHASSLLLIDIDHFKSVNDRFGHLTGDATLRAIGAVLRGAFRRQDVAGRYGGEEFGVVLPGTDAAGARVIAERVREQAAAATLVPGHDVRVTVSIGVAALEADDADTVAWLARADAALYAAKAQGRNCVVVQQPNAHAIAAS
jgi:diguanylate cyclase